MSKAKVQLSKCRTFIKIYIFRRTRYSLVIQHDVGCPDLVGWNPNLLHVAIVLRVPPQQLIRPNLQFKDGRRIVWKMWKNKNIKIYLRRNWNILGENEHRNVSHVYIQSVSSWQTIKSIVYRRQKLLTLWNQIVVIMNIMNKFYYIFLHKFMFLGDDL